MPQHSPELTGPASDECYAGPYSRACDGSRSLLPGLELLPEVDEAFHLFVPEPLVGGYARVIGDQRIGRHLLAAIRGCPGLGLCYQCRPNPFAASPNRRSTASSSRSSPSGVEAIISILAIRDGVAPPTLNLDHPSRDSVIDRVANIAQQRKIRVALSNSFGFGGTNASVIFRAPA